MAKIELKRFTNPVVLMRIELRHLVKLFDQFKEGCVAKNRWPMAEPGCDGYYLTWVDSLKRPELLPEPLVEAVRAIEEQVTPENWPRFEATTYKLRMYANFNVNTNDSPESQALQVWLWCPYKAGGNFGG